MKRKNYLTNMVSQYGDNWIVNLSPDDIQRASKRIFREMTRGMIDYEEVGKYFQDAKFLDNLIVSANNELEVNTLLHQSLCLFKNCNPNLNSPLLNAQINHRYALCVIYSTIIEKLNQVKYNNNIGYLVDITGLLYNYKNHI